MIFIFRKEIKKWNKIWWLVLASLALGSASFFFMRQPDKRNIVVATVDGYGISLKQYHHVFAETKAYIDDLAAYWGVPSEKLTGVMGMKAVAETSIQKCIDSVLLDRIVDKFRIDLDEKSFQEALSASISNRFVDPSGSINIQAYQNYLSRFHMSITDYEESKEQEFKRGIIMRAIIESGYVPLYLEKQLKEKSTFRKSFEVMPIPFSSFVAKAKGAGAATVDELTRFYNDRMDNYKVAEKRKASYWIMTPKDYEKNVHIEEELIEKYYEKNKNTIYRIPPKIKIRSMLVSIPANASNAVIEQARKKAETLLEQVKKNPAKFSGTLSDYFSRGAKDPAIEDVAFLKLKNTGDISDVIRTKRGFEIIKLEDRIAANIKPLNSVRNEVIKALRERKAVFTLKGDLESVIRSARNDKAIFDKFAATAGIKENKTDWLSTGDVKGSELQDILIQKIFSKNAKVAFGYFVHQGKHVLYRVSESQESFVPKFDDIKTTIENDWYAEKAYKLQKKVILELKKEFLENKVPFEVLAKKYGFSVLKTPLLEAGDTFAALKDVNFVPDAFVLDDSGQIYEHRNEKNCYLVTLLSAVHEKGKKEEDSSKEAEMIHVKRLNSEAFIASLQRNAKISVHEELLKSTAARGVSE